MDRCIYIDIDIDTDLNINIKTYLVEPCQSQT